MRKGKITDDEYTYKYPRTIQKAGSFYGTIREMEIIKKDAKGNELKQKIVNIYVDPTKKQNVRNYSDIPYSIDIDTVEKDKTQWKNTEKLRNDAYKRARTRKEEEMRKKSTDDVVPIERKRKVRIAKIKRKRMK